MQTLIMGIGNSLLMDEGIGIHVMQALKNEAPLSGVSYIDGGTLSFTLAGKLAEVDQLIVIDAAQLQSEPGTVACYCDKDMDQFLGKAKCSVHEVSLIDLFDISRLTETLPIRRALIAIQPLSVEWGDFPSDPLQKAIPLAMQKVKQILKIWEKEQ